MIVKTAKVLSGGRVTIPVEIRRLMDLHPGDIIQFIPEQDGRVVIKKASAKVVCEEIACDSFNTGGD